MESRTSTGLFSQSSTAFSGTKGTLASVASFACTPWETLNPSLPAKECLYCSTAPVRGLPT